MSLLTYVNEPRAHCISRKVHTLRPNIAFKCPYIRARSKTSLPLQRHHHHRTASTHISQSSLSLLREVRNTRRIHERSMRADIHSRDGYRYIYTRRYGRNPYPFEPTRYSRYLKYTLGITGVRRNGGSLQCATSPVIYVHTYGAARGCFNQLPRGCRASLSALNNTCRLALSHRSIESAIYRIGYESRSWTLALFPLIKCPLRRFIFL